MAAVESRDPCPTVFGAAAKFAALRAWVAERIPIVQAQVKANTTRLRGKRSPTR